MAKSRQKRRVLFLFPANGMNGRRIDIERVKHDEREVGGIKVSPIIR